MSQENGDFCDAQLASESLRIHRRSNLSGSAIARSKAQDTYRHPISQNTEVNSTAMPQSIVPKCNTLFLDIRDVLFTWTPQNSPSISHETLLAINTSATWELYECGKLTQEECYNTCVEQWRLDPSEIERALHVTKQSIHINDDLVSFIRELKNEAGDRIRIFSMTNMSQPDYHSLRGQVDEAVWSMFEQVFTSSTVGVRKPELGFYSHVLQSTYTIPEAAVFVDGKVENVLVAQSLGMHGVVCRTPESMRAALRNMFGNPLLRGKAFLDLHAGMLRSTTSTGAAFEDNFAQLLILEVTGQRDLIDIDVPPNSGKWNFFKGTPVCTTTHFPDDLETTSLAMTILPHNNELVHKVMDEMLSFQSPDGIVQLYFDHERRRIDPVCCLNILSLFHFQGRGSDLAATQAWIFNVLKHRAYLDGTRYYAFAECFLYFLSRLLMVVDSEVQAQFQPLLKERLQERLGAPGDAIALAMRIIACTRVGVRDEVDIRRLLTMQLEDGSWAADTIYKYGKSGVGIGNAGLSTVLALDAICIIEGKGGAASLWGSEIPS